MRVSSGAHLKRRRAWTRDKSNGRPSNSILQRTPAIILDTRLNDTQNKGTYRCDECEAVFHGPFQEEFAEKAKHLSYEELSSGWKHGTVDASWFCVDCWADKLDIDSVARTRDKLGLPRASRPAAVLDNRFHQHPDRWSICDNCDCYCTGRARDWLPGSFVYCEDNSLTGPPMLRKGCFPKLHKRETLWRNGTWNAKFLCRACLVQQWEKKPWEIERWLSLHNDGAWKAASIQRRLRASSGGGGWQSGWSAYQHGNWWGSNQRLEVTQQ